MLGQASLALSAAPAVISALAALILPDLAPPRRCCPVSPLLVIVVVVTLAATLDATFTQAPMWLRQVHWATYLPLLGELLEGLDEERGDGHTAMLPPFANAEDVCGFRPFYELLRRLVEEAPHHLRVMGNDVPEDPRGRANVVSPIDSGALHVPAVKDDGFVQVVALGRQAMLHVLLPTFLLVSHRRDGDRAFVKFGRQDDVTPRRSHVLLTTHIWGREPLVRLRHGPIAHLASAVPAVPSVADTVRWKSFFAGWAMHLIKAHALLMLLRRCCVGLVASA